MNIKNSSKIYKTLNPKFECETYATLKSSLGEYKFLENGKLQKVRNQIFRGFKLFFGLSQGIRVNLHCAE